eukprot:TRINITY_DN22573_c0_g1_i1.p1 TRINITY_DN22573_c0_g1~~TRINITY_DN22573_c0_g1_i1.p1  ORF type:complete len:120 (-),score=34.38 TRINITY_DN22573_c0_g1_i1:1-360(-)
MAAANGGDAQFKIGDQVLVVNAQLPGVVKFVGATEFSAGVWIGVALSEPAGKNDGEVKGVRYFQCPPLHGIFVRAANLQPLDAAPAAPAAAAAAAPAAPAAAPAPAAPAAPAAERKRVA